MSEKVERVVTYYSEVGTGLTIEQVWENLKVAILGEVTDAGLLMIGSADLIDFEEFVLTKFDEQYILEGEGSVPKAHTDFLLSGVTVLYNHLHGEEPEESEAEVTEEEVEPVVAPQESLVEEGVQHYAHWVGGKFHSRESFFLEAEQMGVSIRIGRIPKELIVGESRVYLVSDLTEEERQVYLTDQRRKKRERRKARRAGKAMSFQGSEVRRGSANVFAYFIVKGIVLIVSKGMDVPEELKRLGVKKWEYEEGKFGFDSERACGSLEVGGTYVLSEEDMLKVQHLAEDTQLQSKNILRVVPPVPWRGGRFRGLKKFGGLTTTQEGVK